MKASTPVVVTHTPPTAPFFPICVALLVGGFVFLTGAVGFLFLQQARSRALQPLLRADFSPTDASL